MLKIDAIACIDNNNAIGYMGDLLYKHKDDMKLFKEITLEYQNMVMGHNTFKSLPKILDGRMHFVLTSNKSLLELNEPRMARTRSKSKKYHPQVRYITKLSDLDFSLKYICIGGASLYKMLYSSFNILHITHIDTVSDKYDAVFPSLNYKIHALKYREHLQSYNDKSVVYKKYIREQWEYI